MRVAGCLILVSLLSVSAAIGCGDSDKGESLSHLTPAELCEKRCASEVAANCAKTPTDFGTSCVQLCQGKYESPNCIGAARALDTCIIQFVTYGCESDVISARPQGACATEGVSCGTCTGNLLSCL